MSATLETIGTLAVKWLQDDKARKACRTARRDIRNELGGCSNEYGLCWAIPGFPFGQWCQSCFKAGIATEAYWIAARKAGASARALRKACKDLETPPTQDKEI